MLFGIIVICHFFKKPAHYEDATLGAVMLYLKWLILTVFISAPKLAIAESNMNFNFGFFTVNSAISFDQYNLVSTGSGVFFDMMFTTKTWFSPVVGFRSYNERDILALSDPATNTKSSVTLEGSWHGVFFGTRTYFSNDAWLNMYLLVDRTMHFKFYGTINNYNNYIFSDFRGHAEGAFKYGFSLDLGVRFWKWITATYGVEISRIAVKGLDIPNSQLPQNQGDHYISKVKNYPYYISFRTGYILSF